MNKALEQKLIGPLEESHTEKNPPKQFCEWSFEQGDKKWQQDELELVLELDGDFFGRKMECVGAGVSGGGPPRAHEIGGCARYLVGPWWPSSTYSCTHPLLLPPTNITNQLKPES